MATLIPARSTCLGRMTSGEKRLSERLEQKLEDDYLLWYDVPIGLKQRQPDFVILHPRRGLLVLEVKDWKLENIHSADKNSFTLLTNVGQTHKINPLLQARTCMLEINVVLERDPALRHPAGGPHAGKLLMPWGFGVVLSNITRKQFIDAQLDNVIPNHLVICKDEMYETVDAEVFQERLWAMFPHPFPCALTLPQIDRVRWLLFPEVRVNPAEGQFGLFGGKAEDAARPIEIPDLIKVMDLKQEQLARSLGHGHRVIHGVAGSGKTMILGYRCMHLANALNKPVLVLCYNKTLASWLKQLMEERGLAEKVNVRNFHSWCWQMLKTYHVPRPEEGNAFDGMVQAVINGVESGQIPRAQYGAVMIDEGHDFEPEWYKLVVQMVDPATNSLLILYDDAQNIYGKSARRQFTWKSVGVEAVGHTTILKLNYRNTLEILGVASGFASDLLNAHASDDDGIPLIAPESAGRRGELPVLVKTPDETAETAKVVELVRSEQAQKTRLSDIAVLYRTGAEGQRLGAALKAAHIPYRLARGKDGKAALFDGEDSVKLVTMHSSKGLEFPVVIVVGLGQMPFEDAEETAEARLLYVSMTRAKDRLVMMHHRQSPFTRRVEATIQATRAATAGNQRSVHEQRMQA
ncbi:MAG TPA: 3'-5' exonuclease [Gammaproteobacteria bacterium]|nr:3'-5' exonuclease [Gammaproteobacteria bacterium]